MTTQQTDDALIFELNGVAMNMRRTSRGGMEYEARLLERAAVALNKYTAPAGDAVPKVREVVAIGNGQLPTDNEESTPASQMLKHLIDSGETKPEHDND